MRGKLTLLLVCAMSFLLTGCRKEENLLNIREEEIIIPTLERDYELFFIADSHVTLCDKKDSELIEKNNARKESFIRNGKSSDWYFKELIKEAKNRRSDLIVMGGDIVDSAMYASIDFVKKQLDSSGLDYIYASGNHDFEYGDEYFSSLAYEKYRPRLEVIHSPKFYDIKEYDDLIIFSVDDEANQIPKEAVEAFAEIVKKDKAIIVVTHVPFEPLTGDLALNELCKETWGESSDGKSRVTMGFNGCYPNSNTLDFAELLAYSKNVYGILAGHVHFYHKDIFYDNKYQIITAAAFEGQAISVRLKSSGD